MNMTYRQLRDALNELSEEELDLTAMVANSSVYNEQTKFFPVVGTYITGEEDDVLDAYHPVILCDF